MAIQTGYAKKRTIGNQGYAEDKMAEGQKYMRKAASLEGTAAIRAYHSAAGAFGLARYQKGVVGAQLRIEEIKAGIEKGPGKVEVRERRAQLLRKKLEETG